MIVNLPITGAWLTDLSNVSVNLDREYPPGDESDALDGAVKVYAGGRRRMVSTESDTVTVPLVFPMVTSEKLAQLRAWRGAVLLLRTAEWRRWGGFFAVTATPRLVTEDPAAQIWRVQITWTDIDRDESV